MYKMKNLYMDKNENGKEFAGMQMGSVCDFTDILIN